MRQTSAAATMISSTPAGFYWTGCHGIEHLNLWEANFLQKKNFGPSTGNLLFHDIPIEFKLPILHQHPLNDALDEIELMIQASGRI